MSARILYKASVEKDVRRLDRKAALRIMNEIEETLAAAPGAGTALAGEFKGLFRLRLGAYRVIYSRVKSGVLVLRIAHRKEAYR